MVLHLVRTYDPLGTNGLLFSGAQLVCRTIELPWKDNAARISCIPEGPYELARRYSKKYGHHLLVKGVPNRSYILIHPANIAAKELQGCIAPVTAHTGPGRGSESRKARDQLHQLVYPILENQGKVYLQIEETSSVHTSIITRHW